MFEHYIRQLKSQQVLERRQAIVKITNSGHPEALAVLEKFLRIEQDPEIRALTEKAIHYLKTNKPAAASAPAASSHASSQMNKPVAPAADKIGSGVFMTAKPDHHPAPEHHPAVTGQPAPPPAHLVPLPPPKPVTEQQKKLAKGKLDTAMQLQLNGKIDEALLSLKRAFELNPELERDSFAYGLASALTGGGGDPIALVKQSSKPEDKATKALVAQGATTALNFAIEMAILTIVFIMYFAISYRKFAEIAAGLSQYAMTTGASSASFTALDLFTSSTRNQLLVSALTQGIGVTISGIAQAFLMFVVGILIGGTGNLLDFLRTVMRVTAGIYLAIGAVFLIFPASSWLPVDLVTGQPTTFSPFILLGIIAFVGSILWVYFAGRAHGFGFFKGCAMIVLTSIGFSVLVFIVALLARPSIPTDLPGIIMPLLSLR